MQYILKCHSTPANCRPLGYYDILRSNEENLKEVNRMSQQHCWHNKKTNKCSSPAEYFFFIFSLISLSSKKNNKRHGIPFKPSLVHTASERERERHKRTAAHRLGLAARARQGLTQKRRGWHIFVFHLVKLNILSHPWHGTINASGWEGEVGWEGDIRDFQNFFPLFRKLDIFRKYARDI